MGCRARRQFQSLYRNRCSIALSAKYLAKASGWPEPITFIELPLAAL
jgi:hypothetical protein